MPVSKVLMERNCEEINIAFNSQHIQAAHPLKQFNAERPPTLIVQFTRNQLITQEVRPWMTVSWVIAATTAADIAIIERQHWRYQAVKQRLAR
ncbi:hypothetical protein J6590_056495 [Homalodisca vitripennis]|nr:hypothetical protein J6590_056495 [Homalodisca vitripennis]